MSISLDFTGRVVVVTGGARGVGHGIATCFLEAGAQVLICGRSEPAPDTLPTASGRRAQFIAADVRGEAQVDALIATARERYGRLDVMIPNAGGAPSVAASDASHNFHQKVVGLNLLAPLLCAQRANAVMQQQETGGVVIFIGSVSARRPSPGTAAYAAAKAGLRALAMSLAVEWAPKVRVLVVSAGMVRTEQARLHYGGEAGIRAVAATVPLARLATPEDIGNACLFLASPLASYASGTELLLHGGGESPPFLRAVEEASRGGDG